MFVGAVSVIPMWSWRNPASRPISPFDCVPQTPSTTTEVHGPRPKVKPIILGPPPGTFVDKTVESQRQSPLAAGGAGGGGVRRDVWSRCVSPSVASVAAAPSGKVNKPKEVLRPARSRTPLRSATGAGSQSNRPSVPCEYYIDTDSDGEPEKASQVKFVGPRNPSALADDPAYHSVRAQPLPLPMTVSACGRLNSVEYSGDGWPMIFRNPMKPDTAVNSEDFSRVISFLVSEFKFTCLPVVRASVGVYQTKLGTGGKGQGNLQFWVTRFDHPQGNCKFHGSLKRLLEIRTIISRSMWFLDTVGFNLTRPVAYTRRSSDSVSRMLLPAVNTRSPLFRIEAILVAIFKEYGLEAKPAMCKYIARSGLTSEPYAMQLVQRIFVESGRR